MDKKKFLEKNIKVGGTTGVEPVVINYKDKDYFLKTYPNSKASQHGHVVIAELSSNDQKLPTFLFRWDHGMGTIDVDIFLNGESRKDLWKQKGYNGHWTKITDDEKREYSFLIEIPKRKIFEGTIKVGLLTELNSHENVKISEYTKIEIV